MLRTTIADTAQATAKGFGHASVEPRHVIYALARHFRGEPSGEELLKKARMALEPRGEAHTSPTMTAPATAVLESISSPGTALEVLRHHLGSDPETGPAAGPANGRVTAQQTPLEQQARSSATTEAPPKQPGESASAILDELDALIGLASVKTQVRQIMAVVQANQERRNAGLAPIASSHHLVFTGPPGTGKTTVARLVARLYAATGALPGHNFIEGTRSDLVAEYVGQTAIKTAQLIARARPGVLFIDEAYALTPSHQSDFGAEAIATLVKAMEDYREDLAVIVAGYNREMSDFVQSNPGLRSRFKTFVDFPDYSPSDLTRIFEKLVLGHGILLTSGARDRAAAIFARAAKRPDFGNARFARSLFEQAYTRMAARAAADGAISIDELASLAEDDIAWEEQGPEGGVKRVGFRPDAP